MLEDVRVVDLTRLLPGPYATQLLADLGADVVKVESPDGDFSRYSEPFLDGVGGIFSMVNRGKRSVELDLKDDAALEAFYALVEDADAVVEGYRPGVADRLGVGYEDVREVNEDIVYCSLSGYGQEGDLSDKAGHDLNYAAYAGFLDMTRADGEPAMPGYPIGDMSGGMTAALAVVSALLGREHGAGGEYIDASMAESVLSFSQAVVPEAIEGDDIAGETPLSGGYACYNIYETSDGEHATLAGLEPKFWYEFCEVVGREDLVGDHPGGEETYDEVAEIFASKTLKEWNETFEGTDVPFQGIRSLGDALEDDDVQERMLRGGDETPPRVGFPATTDSGVERETDESVPEHGEHTREVLREAGLSDEEIDGIESDG
jgi:crotonobetainyl-CoA:carnitine CoA-transferase CaiB-like acyl-CoA transferase